MSQCVGEIVDQGEISRAVGSSILTDFCLRTGLPSCRTGRIGMEISLVLTLSVHGRDRAPSLRFYSIHDLLHYFAAAASNRLKSSSFFSAGRKDASNELRASSRRCSSVNPKVSWAS